MRTIIDLTDEQVRRLAEVCERERISRAEAIRRAVDGYIGAESEDTRKRLLTEAFGSWKSMGISTDDYLAEIRAEWEHDDRDPVG